MMYTAPARPAAAARKTLRGAACTAARFARGEIKNPGRTVNLGPSSTCIYISAKFAPRAVVCSLSRSFFCRGPRRRGRARNTCGPRAVVFFFEMRAPESYSLISRAEELRGPARREPFVAAGFIVAVGLPRGGSGESREGFFFSRVRGARARTLLPG